MIAVVWSRYLPNQNGKGLWWLTFKVRIVEKAGSVRRDPPRDRAFLAKAENFGESKINPDLGWSYPRI